MFGFVVGTLCLVGLVGMIGHGRHAHGYAHGYGRRGFGRRFGRWHGHHGRGGWGGGEGQRGFGGPGFARVAAEVVKRRLRIDEDQEGIVDHAVADLRAAVSEFSEALKASRADIAAAFRGETVDDAALAAVFTHHDEELARTRRTVVSALKQIHAVLDEEQRGTASEWLGSADPRWV